MKNIKNYFLRNILLIKWSFWYILTLWAILQFLFEFNIFSAHYWNKFYHSSFHGFWGFIFQIIIYSAIPIYIATIYTINKTQKNLISLSWLKKIKRFVFNKSIKQEQQPEPVVEEHPQEETIQYNFPKDLPSEMRTLFIRSKQHRLLRAPVSIFNKTQQAENNTIINTDIPLPTDFNIDTNVSESIPVFTDINFDNEQQQNNIISETLQAYLQNKNINYEIVDRFIITSKHVIYNHYDDRFWIMDKETWFTNGKQQDSPIKELLKIAKEKKLSPIIVLESNNIMNLDETIQSLQEQGINIISDLDKL